MELIIDNIEVVTIHEIGRVTEEGQPLERKQIRISGHLSKNLFPFWVHCAAKLPPHEYPLWPVHAYDKSAIITAPFSAKFTSTVNVTRNYGVVKPGPMPRIWWLTIDGLYKITLQASWTPLFVVPVAEPKSLEVDTEGRNDRDIFWRI